MPQTFTWGLIALSFPIGLPVGAGVGLLMTQAYRHLGLPYLPFLDLLPSWVVMLGFAYLQWFVLLPALLRHLDGRRGRATLRTSPPGRAGLRPLLFRRLFEHESSGPDA